MSPYPLATSPTSSVVGVSVRETVAAVAGTIVEVLSSSTGNRLVVKVNGFVVNVQDRTQRYSQGSITGSADQSAVLIRLTASNIHVRVTWQARSNVTSMLAVSVDVNQGDVACGCR
jgi:hypothetical protein